MQQGGHDTASKGHDTAGLSAGARDACAHGLARGESRYKNCIVAGGGLCIAIWVAIQAAIRLSSAL